MTQFEEIYGKIREAVLDRYAAVKGGQPGAAFVAFEFGTPVPEDTFQLRDEAHTLSPDLGNEFLSRQSNMIPDVANSMLTRSERTLENQYDMMLAGAMPTSQASVPLFEHVKSRAVESFDATTPSLLMGSGSYRPILATPATWYDTSKEEGWSTVTIKLQDDPPPPSPPIDPRLLNWKIAPEALRPIIGERVTRKTFEKIREAPLETGLSEPAREELDRVRSRNIFLKRVAAGSNLHGAGHSVGTSLHGAGHTTFGGHGGLLSGVGGAHIEVEGVASPDPDPEPQPDPASERHLNLLLHADAIADFQQVVGVASTDQPVTGDSFYLDVDLCLVTISRPWIADDLLTLPEWYVPNFPKGKFSSGSVEQSGLMGLLPTACILIRNLIIHSNWSDQDLEAVESSSSLGGFSLFGRSFDRASMTLTVPGMQMFAWVCEPLPVLPPSDPPSV